jgi:TetR/AcrR family transcriptional repressor of mexJK operon
MTAEPELTTTRPDWLEPLSDPKSEQILSAAFDVFKEQGLHCATMLAVAKRARVSKETLYARFDSKEGLFYALLAWGARQGATATHALDEIADPVEALHAYARALLTAFIRPESLAVYRMAVAESGRDPEIGRNFNELSCTDSEDVLGALCEALVRRSVIEAAPVADYQDTLLGLLRGNYHHNVLTGSLPSPSEQEIAARAQRCVTLFLRAYAKDAASHAIAAE